MTNDFGLKSLAVMLFFANEILGQYERLGDIWNYVHSHRVRGAVDDLIEFYGKISCMWCGIRYKAPSSTRNKLSRPNTQVEPTRLISLYWRLVLRSKRLVRWRSTKFVCRDLMWFYVTSNFIIVVSDPHIRAMDSGGYGAFTLRFTYSLCL